MEKKKITYLNLFSFQAKFMAIVALLVIFLALVPLSSSVYQCLARPHMSSSFCAAQ